MKIVTALLLVTLSLFVSQNSVSEELNPEKKKLIDELLEITGAPLIEQTFLDLFAQQMIEVLTQENPNLDPRAIDIVREEVRNLSQDEIIINKQLLKQIYPIYHKYLSLGDIEELIRFYKTPVGGRVLAALPNITRESMLVGQAWGQSLGSKIHTRVMRRLKEEGINIDDQ